MVCLIVVGRLTRTELLVTPLMVWSLLIRRRLNLRLIECWCFRYQTTTRDRNKTMSTTRGSNSCLDVVRRSSRTPPTDDDHQLISAGAIQPPIFEQMQKNMMEQMDKRRVEWEHEVERMAEDFFQVSLDNITARVIRRNVIPVLLWRWTPKYYHSLTACLTPLFTRNTQSCAEGKKAFRLLQVYRNPPYCTFVDTIISTFSTNIEGWFSKGGASNQMKSFSFCIIYYKDLLIGIENGNPSALRSSDV